MPPNLRRISSATSESLAAAAAAMAAAGKENQPSGGRKAETQPISQMPQVTELRSRKFRSLWCEYLLGWWPDKVLEGCKGFRGDSGLPTTSTKSLSSLSTPLVLSGLFSSELCLWAASRACLRKNNQTFE